ncbi:MAG TPA: acylphosphatase [Terriglobales bacterium]|nr:acylphosphatase [Terriglobales bacterium]
MPVSKAPTDRSPGALLTAVDLQSVILRWLTLVTGTIVARRFIVRGRVQGVGFRWFVEREAHILGIAGWVRNNADSSVEVLAQGTKEQLAELRSRLRQGPRAARVDDVEESESRPISEMNTFRIEGAW